MQERQDAGWAGGVWLDCCLCDALPLLQGSVLSIMQQQQHACTPVVKACLPEYLQ